jgi:hypothetical protein
MSRPKSPEPPAIVIVRCPMMGDRIPNSSVSELGELGIPGLKNLRILVIQPSRGRKPGTRADEDIVGLGQGASRGINSRGIDLHRCHNLPG